MNGLIRKAGVFTLGALLLASMAVAGVPSGTTSTIGAGVVLGDASTGSGSPDGTDGIDAVRPESQMTMTIRDGNNVAVPNVAVVIDFSACDEFHFCSAQTHPGMTVNCGLRTVTATTDALGQVSFRVFGHALNPGGGGAGETLPCATVTSLGQALKTLRVSAFDQNGAGGVNVADGSLVDADRNAWVQSGCSTGAEPGCIYHTRSDFNADGLQNPADKSLWSAVRAQISGGAPSASCAVPPNSNCP